VRGFTFLESNEDLVVAQPFSMLNEMVRPSLQLNLNWFSL
jgi:hypothetical protein